MRLGDCRTCRRADHGAIEAAHDAGETTRALSRRFGIPEATLRRHFRECRRPAAARPAERPVTRKFLEDLAAEFGLGFAELLRHHVLCKGGDVVTKDEDEARALCALLADGAPCCG